MKWVFFTTAAVLHLAVLQLLLPVGHCQPAAALISAIYEWRFIDFTFPNPASRQAMIHQGLYIPNNSVPLDVDMYNDRVFITVPRFKKGIPATLTTISNQGDVKAPLLEPYPNWSWHKPGHCEGMTSVFRVKIDECARLWVLDTGSINIFTGIRHVCPKQILVFDLKNDKLVRRHRFPQRVIKPDTILTSIAVDVRDKNSKCRATFAYVTDTTTYGLIVYDAKNDRSWRITANSFWPIPAFGAFSLQGSDFELMDGILGIALSPNIPNKPRTLYYHSLSSDTENYVSTAIVQNESLFLNGTNLVPREFKTFPAKRAGQSAAIDVTSDGILFYSELVSTSLNCYNTDLKYNGKNNPSVAQDYQRLQFASGLKILRDVQGYEIVAVMTTRLQKLIAGTMTPEEVNFRVLSAPVHALVSGTNCAVSATPVRFSDTDQNKQGHNPEAIVFVDKK